MFGEMHLYPGVALAGLVSFLSPCVLPLVPPYLSYIGGTTIEELASEDGIEHHVWQRVVLAAVMFVFGFTTVFVAMGASASALGQLVQAWRMELSFAAGVVIILFGLHFLGLLRVPALYREARYQRQMQGASLAGAYLIGLAFAFGWTPCIGPILATVLALAASTDSLGAGVRLLGVYSLGLGIPFIVAAIAIQPFLGFLQKFRRHMHRVEMAMGLMLVLTGIAFLNIIDWFSINAFGQWLIETFPALTTLEEAVMPTDLQGEILKQRPGAP